MPKKEHPLVKQFDKAGLVLKVHDEPLRSGRGMNRIVQIDVGRSLQGNTRHEWFRMYIPDSGALLQVRNVDKKISQLVLLVKEKETKFEQEVFYSSWNNDSFEDWVQRQRDNLARGSKVKSVHRPGSKKMKRGGVIVETKTDPDTRYFLMGVDERQLFIAQLTQAVTTVAEAHRNLGSTVEFFEGKRKGSAMDRQGEWFFLETSEETRREINKAIKGAKGVLIKKANIGGAAGRNGGNPHTADELVKLNGIPLEHGWPVRGERVFVRGKVRHVDHKTVKFSHWREVIANNEGATAQASAAGVLWVD